MSATHSQQEAGLTTEASIVSVNIYHACNDVQYIEILLASGQSVRESELFLSRRSWAIHAYARTDLCPCSHASILEYQVTETYINTKTITYYNLFYCACYV